MNQRLGVPDNEVGHSPSKNSKQPVRESACISTNCADLECLLRNNLELCSEIQAVREDYEQAVAALRGLRATLGGTTYSTNHDMGTVSALEKVVNGEPMSVDVGELRQDESSDEEPQKDCSKLATLGKTEERFVYRGMEIIENMWDGFSVDDYTVEDEPYGKRWAWRPYITVPQPFSMTTRERKKSRSMIAAAQERINREAQVEAELKKQFRAKPAPLSTYEPLIRAEDGKKAQTQMKKNAPWRSRELHRDGNCKNLPRSIDGETSLFKAKPVPIRVLDSEITEKMKEQEEYRKIRIKVRAERMLSSSQLPFSLRSKSAAVQAYCEFETRKLYPDKTVGHMTGGSVQPGSLKDMKIYKEKEICNQQKCMQARPKTTSTPSTPSTPKHCSSSAKEHLKSLSAPPPYATPATRTVKLRNSAVKKVKDASNEKKDMKHQILKQRSHVNIKEFVVKRCANLDISPWLAERRRKKIRELKKQQQERARSYQNELREMQKKLVKRPLLFEPLSFDHARKIDGVKCRTALKKAGFSDIEIETLSKYKTRHA